MTDLSRAEQSVEQANNFHRLILEYAKEQAKAHYLSASDFEWNMFALGLQDNCDELFAGMRKDLSDLRENYDEIQRARGVDSEISARKNGDYL